MIYMQTTLKRFNTIYFTDPYKFSITRNYSIYNSSEKLFGHLLISRVKVPTHNYIVAYTVLPLKHKGTQYNPDDLLYYISKEYAQFYLKEKKRQRCIYI